MNLIFSEHCGNNSKDYRSWLSQKPPNHILQLVLW